MSAFAHHATKARCKEQALTKARKGYPMRYCYCYKTNNYDTMMQNSYRSVTCPYRRNL